MFMAVGGLETFLNSPHTRAALRPPRRALLLIALVVSGGARAELPEFDGTTFDRGLVHTNLFDWIDFDSQDVWVSWPDTAPDQVASGLTSYVAERIVHDDNIYRLPAQGQPPGAGSIASRADDINTITAGVDGHLSASSQSLELLARVDENHFVHNGNLDNTSGRARAVGDWTLGSRLSGQVGASYDRELTDFANFRVYTKDLVSTDAVFAAAHLELGSHWLLNASARDWNTSHSSDDIKYRDDLATFSAQYHTSGGTYVTGTYQYTNGRNPLPAFVENSSSLQIDAPLGNTLRVRADVGYIQHDYPQAAHYDFSGGIWDAQIAWQPRAKIQLLVAGSRQVHAYIDAQSQYFVSEGVRAVGMWAPTAKLTCEVEFSREDQRYIGPNPTVISLSLPEHNLIHARQFNLAWSIFRPVQVVVSYRFVTRDSNASVFIFDDSLFSASVRARF